MKEKKHYIIKTHTSHKWLIALLILLLLFLGYQMYTKISGIDYVDENTFRVTIIGLLFSITLILMVLVVIAATFYIEVKEKYFDD